MTGSTITGTLEDSGRTLVLRRTCWVTAERLWSALTDAAELGQWFGTWAGDPEQGTVAVTMNAEPGDAAPQDFVIHRCRPGEALTVSSETGLGTWRLTLLLVPSEDGTTLEFRHEDLDRSQLAQIGPGWEWYLDRLAAVLAGTPLPGIAEFEAAFGPQGAAYAALLTDVS